MEKILETFKSTLKNNPDTAVSFALDADDPQSMRFIEYLRDNRTLIEHNGKITFVPYGKNVENFICGIAPMWKEYSSRQDFEFYYTQSEMMRALFCNERDDDNKLIPIYANIDGTKYIVTWESRNDSDTFHYRVASSDERGLLDMLWSIYGGIESEDEVRQLNPQIGISFEMALSKNYGYNFGLTKNIYEHADKLGYSVGGNIKLSIG